MQKLLLILAMLVMLVLAGCSTTDDKIDNKTNIETLNAQDLTIRAKNALNGGNYNRAIELLEEIDTRFPFGRISEQVKLDLIFAYFKKGNFESGQTLADRFIRQHPQHKNIDYVYYMKGVMYFEEEQGALKNLFSAEVYKRDTTNLKASFDNFKALAQVYPESEYAPDARKRMILIRNLLARHELHVAKFYMTRDSYIGAANRAKYIIENYPKTPAVPRALEILITSYKLLELPELAEKYRRVLLLNYPNYQTAEI